MARLNTRIQAAVSAARRVSRPETPKRNARRKYSRERKQLQERVSGERTDLRPSRFFFCVEKLRKVLWRNRGRLPDWRGRRSALGRRKSCRFSGAWAAQPGDWSAWAGARGGGGKQRNRRCCRAGRGRAEHARRHDAQRVRSLALRSACAALQHGVSSSVRRVPACGKAGGTGRGSRQGGPFVLHCCGLASFCRRGGIRREIRPAVDHGCGGVRSGAARVRIRLSDAAPESAFFPRPSS